MPKTSPIELPRRNCYIITIYAMTMTRYHKKLRRVLSEMGDLKMQESSFDMIDVLKLIASVMIFMMHTGQLYAVPSVGYAWELLSRWGVPFFFITSSFFLFSKETNGQLDPNLLRRYCRRIALLYAGWFVINLPGTIAGFCGTHDFRNPVVWLIFLKDAVLSSTFTGSWYLLSCMFSAWLVTALGKRFSVKQTILLTVPFQCLCILNAGYAGLISTGTANMLNFLCFPINIFGGCFCFAIGRLLAQNKSQLSRYRSTGIVLSIVGSIAFFIEMDFARRLGWYGSSDQGLLLTPWALGIFLFAVNSKKKFKHALMYRKISTIVYCGQGNVHALRSIVRIVFGIDAPSVLILISVCCMGLIVSIVLTGQNRKKPVWFAYLT